jgi:soluble lytic murein transglycosylase
MALLRALLLLLAPAALLVAYLHTRPALDIRDRLANVTAQIVASPPKAEEVPGLRQALDAIEAEGRVPALVDALRATLALLQDDTATAEEALERFASHPGPISEAVRRYRKGPSREGPETSGDHLVRTLDGWRRLAAEDFEGVARLLPAKKGPGFHEAMLRFLVDVQRHPRDLKRALEHLDALRNQVSQPPGPGHLGFGPDPFDPVVVADPDGSLALVPGQWRGALVPIRDSLRRRSVDVYLALAHVYHAQGKTHRALFQAAVLHENSRDQVVARGQGAALDRLLYPRPYWGTIVALAKEHDLDPWMICAVAREESKWNSQAGSGAGAQGLMQLMPATAREITRRQGKERLVGVRELRDPEANLALGAWYLRFRANMFAHRPTRWKWALAAYNGGIGNAQRWLDQWKRLRRGKPDLQPEDVIDFKETREYIGRVLASRDKYEELYGPAPKG